MKQSTLDFGKKGEKRPISEISKGPQEEAKTTQQAKRGKIEGSPKDVAPAAVPAASPPDSKVLEKKTEAAKSKGPKKPKTILHKMIDRQFHPINDAPFDYNENVPFSFLVESLQEIEKCKGENSKDAVKEILSNVFRSICILHPTELASAFYFYIVKLAPEYKSKETGMEFY